MVTQETELKLALAPRTLGRLAADPLIGNASAGARTLAAVYFDTPRFSLWRHGIALRLRHEQGAWVQGVKCGGAVQAGLHRRSEIEHPAGHPVPDFSLLGDDPIRELVSRAVGKATLVPLFRVEVERTTHLVSPFPGTSIEVSLDRGAIFAGEARVPVCEVELELKEGPAWRLFEFALALVRRYTVRTEQRSKAERGYVLAGAMQPAPVHARLGVIQREMSAGDAFRAVCWTCLNHLQANHEGAMRGNDPEYLHQARVALRRLHSGLGVFAPLVPEDTPAPPVKSVRMLARVLGPARDWDVFADEMLAPILKQFSGHRGLAALERACGRLREEAYHAARRVLASRRYQRLVLSLGAWLSEERWLATASGEAREAWLAPVNEHAVEVLEHYYRRVLRRGRGASGLSLRKLHRLRIAVKKLRYAAGFFAPLYVRRRAAPTLEALNDLQNALGAINDCATAPALIEDATRAARGPFRAEARAIVSHWNAAMLEERRGALKPVWKAFHKCEPFWR